MKLGFSVYCEEFSVEYYDNGSPKEYRSDLSFLAEGEPPMEASLLVNHPITFNGITFYQSSFGTIPGKAHLRIRKENGDPEESAIEVEPGIPFSLPGSEAQFQVLDADSNYRGAMGPAAQISVQPQGEGKEEIRFLIFKDMETLRARYPEAMFKSPTLNPSTFKPYTFFLEDLESRYYTGLQVSRDPGVPLVWLGFFLMVAGFIVTFFTSHKKVWVRVSMSQGKAKISVAGRANKNPVGLERELHQVTHKLQKLLTKEGVN